MEQFANTNALTLFTQLLDSITNQVRLSADVSGIEPVLTPEINQSINPEVSSQGGCPNSCERRISSLITNGNSAQSKERQGLHKKEALLHIITATTFQSLGTNIYTRTLLMIGFF